MHDAPPVIRPSQTLPARLRHVLRVYPLYWAPAALGLALLLVWQFIAWEMRGSWLQSQYFTSWAARLTHEVQAGPNPALRVPQTGPFDERLGYTHIPAFTVRLQQAGHGVLAQSRQSEALIDFMDSGFFAPFQEKTQAGLQVLDCRREPLFAARVPRQVYPSYEAIPPLLAQALAFIENRELLSTDAPRHNPALEWGRLGRAVLDQGLTLIDGDHPAAGGSTLATQIEKYRHSPEGRTTSATDKYHQMVSASVRAYAEGADTVAARRRILLDYVNSLPLGAVRGFGDVNGIGDGLAAWYGAGFATANLALRQPQAQPDGLALRGLALRQVLSLFIAQRRPAFYFGAGQRQLGLVLDSYLRLLGQEGVVAPALRDAALQAKLVVLERYREPAGSGIDFDERKAASLLRIQLASLLQVPSLYELDRLDLQTVSTIEGKVQADVTTLLNRLREPQAAKAAGLLDKQLLQRGDPARLLYSFALYESGDKVNRVRVQTDNLDQPFDINNGAKLELGSTAKLRTLVSYLDIIASLHAGLAGLDPAVLAGMKVARKDRLTRWAIDHLRAAPNKSLLAMLEAAMQRRYSANPAEAFYTGGGLHTFANFKPEDNTKTPNLYEALRDSVNLVFIRLMRDVVHHHIYRDPSSAARILEDPDHPDREVLLNRFADREGAQFMRSFYRKYRGQKGGDIAETLVAGVRPTPLRLAVIFRSLEPAATLDGFVAFVAQTLPAAKIPRATLEKLFDQHAPGNFSLSDRGYLAHVHPLELLVAAHLRRHPDATLAQTLEAGAAARREVYSWLFRARARSAQDTRIQSLLELDAFVEIHRGWQRLGYPFASLVPSYATAIGSSGDRPAALAELMGIVVNQGRRQPTVHLEELQFAQGTPYETRLQRQPVVPEQVLPLEVTATVRKALALVVNEGTAKRLKGAVPGPGGEPLQVGGKTGTGDNRVNTYGAGGAQTGSRAINRTATFVFFLGDRHFGTLTAYVPGQAADGYRFTSALPVQILKEMAPLLRPVVGVPAGEVCREGSNAFRLSREIRLEQQPTQVALPPQR